MKEKTEYLIWKQAQFSQKKGFFPVFSDFKPYMKKLSPGAISLYIYLGLHSNYETGESFHSIQKISIFFNKSPRTISNWIRELEDNGLIKREQKKLNGVSHTYLTPYNWEPGYIRDEVKHKSKGIQEVDNPYDEISF